jgi:hypothetical protein
VPAEPSLPELTVGGIVLLGADATHDLEQTERE